MSAEAEKAAGKALLKLRRLPANRICPNCLREDAVGFTAICVPFKTFVCNECKSAHQSFSHRVKSSSQSTWTMDEVKALDEKNGGGNRLASELWLARMPEGERPGQDSSGEAIKRFVDRAYNEELWKSKESPVPSGTGGQEKKHKDKERRRHRTASDRTASDGLEMPPRHRTASDRTASDGFEMPPSGESRSTSQRSSPKPRSRKRGDSSGWGSADFPVDAGGWGAVDLSNPSTPGGGWGMTVNPAMPNGYPCMPQSMNSEPFMAHLRPNVPPSTTSSEPFTAPLRPNFPPSTLNPEPFMAYMAEGYMVPPRHNIPPSTSSSSNMEQMWSQGQYAGATSSLVGREWQQQQLQANAFVQQSTPHTSSRTSHNGVPDCMINHHGGHQPYNMAPASTASRTAEQLPWSFTPATPRSAATPVATTHVSTARLPGGKETVTLHPTNPWADVLGAQRIALEPTNPWADVVGRTLDIRVPAAPKSCASQQQSRAPQAQVQEWVY